MKQGLKGKNNFLIGYFSFCKAAQAALTSMEIFSLSKRGENCSICLTGEQIEPEDSEVTFFRSYNCTMSYWRVRIMSYALHACKKMLET